jgi:hypothetical protein
VNQDHEIKEKKKEKEKARKKKVSSRSMFKVEIQ